MEERDRMTNANRGWNLYARTFALTPRVEKTVYFFSKDGPAQGTIADAPVGYRVAFEPRTRVPILVRIGPTQRPLARENREV